MLTLHTGLAIHLASKDSILPVQANSLTDWINRSGFGDRKKASGATYHPPEAASMPSLNTIFGFDLSDCWDPGMQRRHSIYTGRLDDRAIGGPGSVGAGRASSNCP